MTRVRYKKQHQCFTVGKSLTASLQASKMRCLKELRNSSGRFRRFSCIYNLSRPPPVTGEGANKKINICENTQWSKTELECFSPVSRGGGRLHKALTTKATTYKEDSSKEENENKENTKSFSPLSEEKRSAWQQRQLHTKRKAAKKKNKNKENTKNFSPLSEEQRSLGRWTAA